jgi:hypothetical protein
MPGSHPTKTPRLALGSDRNGGMGRPCCRLRRAAAVGSVRRPSPWRTATGETRRKRTLRIWQPRLALDPSGRGAFALRREL